MKAFGSDKCKAWHCGGICCPWTLEELPWEHGCWARSFFRNQLGVIYNVYTWKWGDILSERKLPVRLVEPITCLWIDCSVRLKDRKGLGKEGRKIALYESSCCLVASSIRIYPWTSHGFGILWPFFFIILHMLIISLPPWWLYIFCVCLILILCVFFQLHSIAFLWFEIIRAENAILNPKNDTEATN